MSPRTLKIVCAVSVLINIFLIGGLIGGMALLHHRHAMIGAGSFRIAGAELPDAQRQAFRQQLRAVRIEMRPTVQQGRQARLEAARLLGAPTLDQTAVAAALGRARDADVAVRTQMEVRAIAFAATLSQADRAKLAEGLERRGGGRGGRRR